MHHKAWMHMPSPYEFIIFKLKGKPMHIPRKLLSLVLAFALVTGPFVLSASAQPTLDNEPGFNAGSITFDLLIMRPVGFLSTVIGTALFVVSLPFTAAHGSTETVYEELVENNVNHTFKRPLGKFKSF